MSRAVKAGKLRLFDDGSIDPSQIGTAWRRGNRDRDADRDSGVTGVTPAVEAKRIVIEQGYAPYSMLEATRIKQNFLTFLRQLEFDERSGAVVPWAEQVAEVAERYGRVSSRMTAMGAELAPRLAPKSTKTAAEIKGEIDRYVREVLTELAAPRTAQEQAA